MVCKIRLRVLGFQVGLELEGAGSAVQGHPENPICLN